MTVWRMCVLQLLLATAAQAHAEAYAAAFDQAQWQVQRSALVCRLTQAVPRFGEAIFEAVGGGRQRFVLHTKKNPFTNGPAELTATAPSWNPARKPVPLGTFDIVGGTEPLQLDSQPTAQLLDSLREGLVPVFARPLQGDANQTTSVALSPVNFLSAYRQYNACIEKLLPVTYDQVKNTVIEFSPDQSELSTAAQQRIDLLLRYVAADHAVTHFELRGVSSDNKRLLDNFTLAKQRTQQVSEYLMSRGIDATAIETRYHGERATTKNPHRFVSIRLKRDIATN